MSTREEDPAFPTFGPRENSGMSLRDYFAGQAMQGIASDQKQMRALGEKGEETGFDPVVLLATGAYAIADVDQFVKTSIRDFADFREDVERLSTTAHRPTLKRIRKEIYDTIDTRVRNSVIAALASRVAPPATTGASTVLTDERIEAIWCREAGQAEAGKRRIAFAHAIEREVAAQAGQVAGWMNPVNGEVTSAANKKQMEAAEFGQWREIATRYTVPLFAPSPAKESK